MFPGLCSLVVHSTRVDERQIALNELALPALHIRLGEATNSLPSTVTSICPSVGPQLGTTDRTNASGTYTYPMPAPEASTRTVTSPDCCIDGVTTLIRLLLCTCMLSECTRALPHHTLCPTRWKYAPRSSTTVPPCMPPIDGAMVMSSTGCTYRNTPLACVPVALDTSSNCTSEVFCAEANGVEQYPAVPLTTTSAESAGTEPNRQLHSSEPRSSPVTVTTVPPWTGPVLGTRPKRWVSPSYANVEVPSKS